MSLIDIKNKKFGRLLVIKESSKRDKSRRVYWECVCDCGNTVTVCGVSLRKGYTKSCGCISKEGNYRKHGLSYSSTYRSWQAMKSRCYNKNNIRYESYGGRGIKVCNRWRDYFENFYADMGERPKSHSIERLDVHKNYSQENCVWLPRYMENWNTTKKGGSYFNKNRNVWQVYVKRCKKSYYVGQFFTQDEALVAYTNAVEEFNKTGTITSIKSKRKVKT